MLRTFWSGCIAAAILIVLPGCASINQRGGIVDAIEDRMLFKAETKSHRLLRSYALVGAMTAVARRSRLSEADKTGISGKLKAALDAANEAYECLYPKRVGAGLPPHIALEQPGICIFFDERMLRLDYTIYKLAAEVLVDQEGKQVFADLQDKMFGDFPVLGPAAKAAVNVVDATAEASTAVQQGAKFVSQLLRFSFYTSNQAVYLYPIYRDLLELDMRLLIDSLSLRCDRKVVVRLDQIPDSSFRTGTTAETCDTLLWAQYIFVEGNGDLKLWREFMRGLDSTAYLIDAYPVHFGVISNWLAQSCNALFKDTAVADCSPLIETAVVNNARALLELRDSEGRIMRASRKQPNAIARSRPPADASRMAKQPAGAITQ